jgi:hypothetical protein
MTVDEILEQVRTLTPQERETLAQQIQAMSAEEAWTKTELDELLTPAPMTGREIVAAGLTGGWHDLNIEDGATWVEKRRRAQREARKW